MEHYETSEDREGTLSGVTLKWDYSNGTVDLSMPGYIANVLSKFSHSKPSRPQHAPSKYTPPNYGAAQQMAPAPRHQPCSPPARQKRIPQIVGALL
mmetsp:Transcript_27097/g.74722  ORF Transcript_27097/g.74722 Transcript_27097/m.74722 type:complete len:96 (-) Transcript_27097:2467-2754(-)